MKHFMLVESQLDSVDKPYSAWSGQASHMFTAVCSSCSLALLPFYSLPWTVHQFYGLLISLQISLLDLSGVFSHREKVTDLILSF
jgi:hypothetical protein